jgi:hypothetical protein
MEVQTQNETCPNFVDLFNMYKIMQIWNQDENKTKCDEI